MSLLQPKQIDTTKTITMRGGNIVLTNGSLVIGQPQTFTLYAGQLESPNNSDWVVNNLASAIADGTYPALTVRAFDKDAEEGVGFYQTIPANVSNLKISIKARSASANGNAVFRLYSRAIPSGSPPGTWSTPFQFNTLTFSNAYFNYFSQIVPLSQLGLQQGTLYLFEFTRYANLAADTLANDVYLVELALTWL